MKLVIPFVLALLATCSLSVQAQELKYELSNAVDIPLAGWNKVLQCSNGNTLLFHFEPRKGIIVKVFDSSHVEIANKKHVCELLDINILDRTHLDWITEINGEAVMFATQQVENRETLLRLRFNTSNGNLINENKVIQSASFKNPTTAYMVNIPMTDDYYIVCKTRDNSKDKVAIKRYNKLHEVASEIPVKIDEDAYDNISLLTHYCNPDGGILIGLCGGKINGYGKYDNDLMFYYFIKGDSNVIQSKLKMPEGFRFRSGGITYDPFDKRMMFVIYNDTEEKNEHNETLSYKDYYLITFAEDLTDFQSMPLENKMVNDLIHQKMDSNQIFVGDLDALYTNDRGQTSLFYEGYTYNKKTAGLIGRGKSIKNFSITQVTDKGKEIWGMSLPYSRLRYEKTWPATFGMVSEYGILNEYYTKLKDTYFVFHNESTAGFARKNMSEAVDSVYDATLSNACFYKIDKKRQVSKSYVFGTPKENEYVQIVNSGTSILKNRLATLIRDRKGKEVTSKIAWIELEP